MARGQAQAASKQLNTTNAAAAGYGANAGSLFGTLVPQANSLINSQGFDPATLSAITNAGMGGVNAAFGDSANQLQRSAAVAGNPASIGGQLDALARSKGLAAGSEAGNIQIANQQEKDTQRQEGLNLLNSIYGTNVGAETSLYGLGPGTLQARAAGPGWAQGFKDVLQGIGALGKGGGGQG